MATIKLIKCFLFSVIERYNEKLDYFVPYPIDIPIFEMEEPILKLTDLSV